MSRENLKCILSLMCIISGLLFNFFSYLLLSPSSPSFIASLILSLGLYIVGGISFFIHYRNHQVITKLKSNEIKLLANWTYHPKDFDQVRYQLEDDRYITYSMIILLGTCGLFICLGTFFTPTLNNVTLGLICILLLLCIVCASFYGVYKYYEYKLSNQHHALISEEYIYFKSELYSVQKSFYFLETVDIIYNTQYYLQFTYGAPGTPYGPFHVLSIPIPEDELATAYQVKSHFSLLIQQTI